jgi:DNA-directed RNA polymerases I and III subunit RPAC2
MHRIKILNDVTLSIENEDHTLINPLKHILSTYKKDEIDFCGYTIPHPSENKVHLVVQYKDEKRQNSENMIDTVQEGIEIMKEVVDKILWEISK